MEICNVFLYVIHPFTEHLQSVVAHSKLDTSHQWTFQTQCPHLLLLSHTRQRYSTADPKAIAASFVLENFTKQACHETWRCPGQENGLLGPCLRVTGQERCTHFLFRRVKGEHSHSRQVLCPGWKTRTIIRGSKSRSSLVKVSR